MFATWFIGEIFHVGIITAENYERTKVMWKNTQPLTKKTQLFFQWCKPDPCLLLNTTSKAFQSQYSEEICTNVYQKSKLLLTDKLSPEATELGKRFSTMRSHLHNNKKDEIKISDAYAFSNLCETLWFGSITEQ